MNRLQLLPLFKQMQAYRALPLKCQRILDQSDTLDQRWETLQDRLGREPHVAHYIDVLRQDKKEDHNGLSRFMRLFQVMVQDLKESPSSLQEEMRGEEIFGVLTYDLALQQTWPTLRSLPCLTPFALEDSFPDQEASANQIRSWFEHLGQEAKQEIQHHLIHEGYIDTGKYLLLSKPFSEEECFLKLQDALDHADVDLVYLILETGTIDEEMFDSMVGDVAKYGHADILRIFLKKRPFSDQTRGYAAWMSASYSGCVDVLQLLLESGTMSQKDLHKALATAAENGHALFVKRLLEQWPLPTLDCSRALMDASEQGHIDVVRVLLEAGSISEEMRSRALDFAIQSNRADIVQLLSQGPMAKQVRMEKVWAAAQLGHLPIQEILLASRQETQNTRSHSLAQALQRAVQVGDVALMKQQLALRPIREQDLELALFYACDRGCRESVQCLLESKTLSEELFRHALLTGAAKGQMGIVQLLLLNRPVSEEDHGAAIREAAEKGHGDVVRLLLHSHPMEEGDWLRIMDRILHEHHDDVAMMQIFLDLGPVPEEYHREMLKQAAALGFQGVLRLLLENRPISQEQRDGAVWRSASNGHLGSIQLLLEGHSMTEEARGCAIESAAQRGYLDIVQCLLLEGSISKIARGRAIVATTDKRAMGGSAPHPKRARRQELARPVQEGEPRRLADRAIVRLLLEQGPIWKNDLDTAITNVEQAQDQDEEMLALLKQGTR